MISTPSQNFLAENFTLPQGEGDDTAFDNTAFFDIFFAPPRLKEFNYRLVSRIRSLSKAVEPRTAYVASILKKIFLKN